MKTIVWSSVLVVCLCACPDTNQPDAAGPPDAWGHPDAGSDAAALDSTTGDLIAPDTLTPDVSRPDALAFDVTRPDLSAPDLSAPDVSAPDLSLTPDSTTPDTANLDAGVGDSSTADSTVADVIHPDAADASAVDAHDHSWLHYVGRHIDTGGGISMAWSGTGVVFWFRGTAAQVSMTDSAGYLTVVVDGVEQPVLVTTSGKQTYTLASGLANEEHFIELYRRTEGFFGDTVIHEVTIEGNAVLSPPNPRGLEVIGDSISCGYGNMGDGPYCPFDAATENHYQTYGAMAARQVGAQLSTIAYSGKGVIHNYGGDTTLPMPELYDRISPNDETTWDFSWQPDAVVINLGTNDFSTDNDPTEQAFVEAYVNLLTDIRSRYPDALILCTIAPLAIDAVAQTYIESAIQQRATQGDPMVQWIDLGQVLSDDGWGCDYHPSVRTHERMADVLEQVLRTELAW